MDTKKEKVKEVVEYYAKLSNIKDQEMLNNLIKRISLMTPDIAIDTILIALSNLFERGAITRKDAESGWEKVASLNPERYRSLEDLEKRLSWIISMNLNHTNMPLDENHSQIMELFESFNKLCGTQFDSFYTGGLIGYIITRKKLERYHSDLDLFINEDQLEKLKKHIDASKDFKFLTRLENKKGNGHEFVITYKDRPVNIGLFLFSREKDGGVILKTYHYSEDEKDKDLYVDETHLCPENAELIFQDDVRVYNGAPFRTLSLENIYINKRNARAKDKRDAAIIEPLVDMEKVSRLEETDRKNSVVRNKRVKSSIVKRLDKKIREEEFSI